MKWEARIGQWKCQHLAYSVLSSGRFRTPRRVMYGAGGMGSMAYRGHGADEPNLTWRALMSSECFSVTDQEGKSMAQHLASAERELSAFVTAVRQLFDPEQARPAADN